jgi:alpha-L-fucosidase
MGPVRHAGRAFVFLRNLFMSDGDHVYKRADFSVLADTKYGVGFHWTTWTAPKTGELTGFEDAVNNFDVPRFIKQVVECGAGHVLFPTCHGDQHMPFPHPVIDSILPGRTCKRDLVMEIADGLAVHGIKLILYYNFSLHTDKEWIAAACPDRKNSAGYIKNVLEIIRVIGERYGKKLDAFWFDTGWQEFDNFPFWEMSQAAKAGNPKRLITFNNSIEVYKAYTPYQDYWWGEGVRLNYIPRGGNTTPGSNLPWYNFVDWHPDYMVEMRCGEWGLQVKTRDLEWPAPCIHSVKAFLDRFTKLGGAVTFNLFIWRDGEIYAEDLALMKQLKALVRG